MANFSQMVSMAKTPDQIDKETAPAAMPASDALSPKYPYGLCIHLENDQLEALGIDGECNVGDEIYLCAKCEVTSVSDRKTLDGKDCRIELQITHLALEDEGDVRVVMMPSEQRAKKRYAEEADEEARETAQDEAAEEAIEEPAPDTVARSARKRYGDEAPAGGQRAPAGGVKPGRRPGGNDSAVKPVASRTGKAGEMHAASSSYGPGAVGAKATAKPVHDPGEAHLRKNNYKRA